MERKALEKYGIAILQCYLAAFHRYMYVSNVYPKMKEGTNSAQLEPAGCNWSLHNANVGFGWECFPNRGRDHQFSPPPSPPPQVLTDNNFYDSQYHGIQLQIFRHVKHDCVHGTVLVIYQT